MASSSGRHRSTVAQGRTVVAALEVGAAGRVGKWAMSAEEGACGMEHWAGVSG